MPDDRSLLARWRAWMRGPASPLLVRLCVAAIVVPFVLMLWLRFRADLPGGPQVQWSFPACLVLLFVFDDAVDLVLRRLARRGIRLPDWAAAGAAVSHLGFAPLLALFLVDGQAAFAVQAAQWAAGTLAVAVLQVLLNAGLARLFAGLRGFRALR